MPANVIQPDRISGAGSTIPSGTTYGFVAVAIVDLLPSIPRPSDLERVLGRPETDLLIG
jgi:hypothetical protein